MLNRFYLHSWLWSAPTHCQAADVKLLLSSYVPITVPFLPLCPCWASGIRKSDKQPCLNYTFHVSQQCSWREIRHFRRRTLSQLSPGHPCPFTSEMGAWRLKWTVLRPRKLRPCFQLLLTAICCKLPFTAVCIRNQNSLWVTTPMWTYTRFMIYGLFYIKFLALEGGEKLTQCYWLKDKKLYYFMNDLSNTLTKSY